jgi:hypothetical protein
MFRDDGLLVYERMNWFEVSDITFIVLKFLGPHDRRQCSCVNRLLHNAADDDELWIPFFEHKFAIRHRPPLRGLSGAKNEYRAEWAKPRHRTLYLIRSLQRSDINLSIPVYRIRS